MQNNFKQFKKNFLGWKDHIPLPGDLVLEVESEQRANEVVEFRKKISTEEKLIEINVYDFKTLLTIL